MRAGAVGSAFVFATALTIAADISTGDSLGVSMGIIGGDVLFGFPTGVALGGLVSESAGNVAAFGLATAFAAVATAVAYRLIAETHVTGDTHRSVKPGDVDTSLSALTVGGVNFAVHFIYVGVLFSTFVVFLDQNGLGVFGLVHRGVRACSWRSRSWQRRCLGSLAGVSATVGSLACRRCLSFSGLPAAGSFCSSPSSRCWHPPLCVFIGIGQGGMCGPLLVLLADLTPDKRMGRTVGTANVFGDIGGSLGPLVTLPLVNRLRFEPIYLACGLLPFAAAVVLVAGVYAETGHLLPSQTAIGNTAKRGQSPNPRNER